MTTLCLLSAHSSDTWTNSTSKIENLCLLARWAYTMVSRALKITLLCAPRLHTTSYSVPFYRQSCCEMVCTRLDSTRTRVSSCFPFLSIRINLFNNPLVGSNQVVGQILLFNNAQENIVYLCNSSKDRPNRNIGLLPVRAVAHHFTSRVTASEPFLNMRAPLIMRCVRYVPRCASVVFAPTRYSRAPAGARLS
jgi:hypothetical protein